MRDVRDLLFKFKKRKFSYYIRPQYVIRNTRNVVKTLIERLPPHRETFYIVKMAMSVPPAAPNIPTIRIDSTDDLLEFARFREKEDPTCKGTYLSELQYRFSRGDVCFAALENSRIVSVEFATFRQHYLREIDYLLIFPDKVCGLLDAYTLNEFRGRGFYKATNHAILAHLARLDFEVLYGWIEPWRKEAFIVHNKLGFKKVILEITMKQRLGFRHHAIRELNISVDEFLQAR